MTMSCPRELELARALDAGDPAVEAHLRGCAGCRDTHAGHRRAIELARELPLELPSHERREEVRTAILAAGTTVEDRPRASRSRLVAAGVLAAAAAIIIYVAARPAEVPAVHARGSVHGQPGARFAAGSPAPDEVVRLEDGVIAVEVEPLGPGERFRVIVGDAEIEVRGTAFDVTARGDRLVAVAVHHGRVEVRPRGGPMATLVANQAWHAPEPEIREAAAEDRGDEVAGDEPPAPLVRNEPAPPMQNAAAVARQEAAPPQTAPPVPRDAARPPRSVAPPARPAAAASERSDVTDDGAPRELTVPDRPRPALARPPEELAYDDGWAAMRTGNFARAATSFARVFIVAPDGSLAEDATFWHAVALARGNRRAEAINAFRDFLELHRRSTHAGEASAMLGWILLETHERDEAARRFRDAAGDPNPAVSTSARAGLAALAPK